MTAATGASATTVQRVIDANSLPQNDCAHMYVMFLPKHVAFFGYENGDECAYVYGTTSGTAGALYNQQINGNNYITQEEFSNTDFFSTGNGCVPSESAVTP
jgi:hypothetical protein